MGGEGVDPEAGEGLHDRLHPVTVDLEVHTSVLPCQVAHSGERGQLLRRPLGLHLEGRAGHVPQVGEAAGLDHPAAPDDRDAVGEGLDLGEDVAGEEHGAAGSLRLGDRLLEDHLHERVEPGGRLVEEQQVDVGDERGDQGDLLPVALGVGARLLRRVEVEAFAQLVAARVVDVAAQPGEEVDRLAAGHRRPQLDVAGHVGQALVQLDRVAPRVATEHPHGAPVGAQQSEEDAHGRGLAGAVWAEEAVDLAVVDLEVEAVEGVHGAEGLDQALGGDDGFGGAHDGSCSSVGAAKTAASSL